MTATSARSMTLLTGAGVVHELTTTHATARSTVWHHWVCSCGHAGIGQCLSADVALASGVEHVRWDDTYPRAEHLLIDEGDDQPFPGLGTTFRRGSCVCDSWSCSSADGLAGLRSEHEHHLSELAS